MATATLKVPGITSQGAAERVETALSGVDGVREVRVDIAGRQVVIDYDDTIVNLNRLREELREESFSVAPD
jgi:copper chaperone CopZ